MLERGFLNETFEVKNLIGKVHRIAVEEVDLQLARAAFLRDAVDFETLDFSKFIDVVNNGAIIVNGGHGIGLAACGGATCAAQHGFDALGGVGVAGDEEKLHLRSHDGCEPRAFIGRDNTLEDVARRKPHRFAVGGAGVMDDL